MHASYGLAPKNDLCYEIVKSALAKPREAFLMLPLVQYNFKALIYAVEDEIYRSSDYVVQ